MHPLKIGIVTTGLSERGGMDRFSKGVVLAWLKRPDIGGIVALTLPNRNTGVFNAEIYEELHYPAISYGLKVQWNVFWACLHRMRNVDLLYVDIEVYGPGAALASVVLRKPFFITLAGTYSVPPKGRSPHAIVKRAMMRFMYRRARMILTMAERNVRLINEVMRVENWRFMPNGVDVSEFPFAPYRSSTQPFILTVGAIKRRKGQDIAIDALGLLKDRFPAMRYKIVGNTSDFPGFVSDLRALAGRLGVEDKVDFLGFIDDEELKRLYQQCTAFVLAARTVEGSFEGFPMVFYEAHGCGAPIISTYGFGSEFVVKNSYNGFLVQPGSAEELAGAIATIAGDEKLRIQMGRHARLEAESHTWDRVAGDYLQVFREFVH